jgi:acyl carrier protein
MRDTLSESDTDAVMRILAHEFSVARAQLTEDAKLFDDLGADSLSMVQISMNLEEAFEISIPDERVDKIQTVGDLLEAVAELKCAQNR